MAVEYDPNLPTTSLTSLYHLALMLNDEGKVVVRTTASGTFSFSGLQTGGAFDEVPLDATNWTPLTAGLSATRNHIWGQNQSSVNMKIRWNDEAGVYKGMIIPPLGTFNIDIKGAIPVFGKLESGTGIAGISEFA